MSGQTDRPSGSDPIPRRPPARFATVRTQAGKLPEDEFAAVYAKVPRLTVEVVLTSADGVLLTLRERGPCKGLWHIPGGTVRYGERLVDAVARVARVELGQEVAVGRLLGYIEYPSHLARGIDWPVGMAFLAESHPGCPAAGQTDRARWFRQLPERMHDEQRRFLRRHRLVAQ